MHVGNSHLLVWGCDMISIHLLHIDVLRLSDIGGDIGHLHECMVMMNVNLYHGRYRQYQTGKSAAIHESN